VAAKRKTQAARRFIKPAEQGGRDIASLDELVEAVLEHFQYDRKESPFPSQEAPPQATRKWYRDRLRLRVHGPNLFEWTCPGCGERVEVETNYLHTCLMFDYEYWQFCPRCADVLKDDKG
jgi:hypothetical protein